MCVSDRIHKEERETEEGEAVGRPSLLVMVVLKCHGRRPRFHGRLSASVRSVYAPLIARLQDIYICNLPQHLSCFHKQSTESC